jgi:hypothetical protein
MKRCHTWSRLWPAGIRGGVLLVLLLSLAGCGCQSYESDNLPSENATNATAPDQSSDLSPGQLLSRMIGAYQSVSSYSDKGKITLRQKRGEQWAEDEDTADFSVTFKRPNQLVLKAYRAAVYCDGTVFRAQITDEPSNHLDGQILVRPAPEKLEPVDLYEEGQRVDPVLAEALSGDLGVVPIQLNLLLADQPLSELL